MRPEGESLPEGVTLHRVGWDFYVCQQKRRCGAVVMAQWDHRCFMRRFLTRAEGCHIPGTVLDTVVQSEPTKILAFEELTFAWEESDIK